MNEKITVEITTNQLGDIAMIIKLFFGLCDFIGVIPPAGLHDAAIDILDTLMKSVEDKVGLDGKHVAKEALKDN